MGAAPRTRIAIATARGTVVTEGAGMAIEAQSLSKSFRYYPTPFHRLCEIFNPFGRHYHVPVPVLHDVSFTVPRGQSVAVIGPNGVGKSTLLHIVAGLLEQSSGTVTARGRVIALFDLGGSFLPDLTGRENARFLHDVVFKGEGNWEERERAIRDFAGIGELFDRPVRAYSSGMLLRLAFAGAICEEPDILLIDEVLAVGDARFQQKCYRRIRELRDRGTTILLVTHYVDHLPSICDRALVLDHGQLVFDGGAGAGVDRYFQLFFLSPDLARQPGSSDEHRHGQGGARIVACFASRDGITPVTAFAAGEVARITLDVEMDRAIEGPQFGFNCSTAEGVRVYTTTSGMLGETPAPAVAGERRRVEITFQVNAATADLFVDLSIFEIVHGSIDLLDVRLGVLHLMVTSPRHYSGITDFSAMINTTVQG
jgi:lipopolysaccharide transport system ATP-binding protein